MFCRYCGKEIQGKKAFCPYCGKQLTQQSAQPAGQPVQRPQNSLAKKKRRFWPVLVWLLIMALLVAGAAGVLAYYEILEIPVVSDVMDMIRDDRFDRPVRDDDDLDDEADEPEETATAQAETLPESEATAQTEVDTTPSEMPTAPAVEMPTEAPTMPPNPLAELDEGDYFTFGCFEQDNNYSNGAEDIKWLVLDKQPGKILVVTRYGLDCQKFHTKSESATWETCTIRTWLNGEFYDAAFDPEEKAQILDTTVTADENPNYNTYAGVATVDKVFLLSFDETVDYMPDNDARFCMPTAYAVSRNAYAHPRSGGCWWLLRTPGNAGNHVMSINTNGSIDYEGGLVDSDRGAVRPAMWISTE